jgi:hypothetical protein
MNQVEQVALATENIRGKNTLRRLAALGSTAAVVGVLSVAAMIPKGEAEHMQEPADTDVTATDSTIESLSTELRAPEATVITTGVEETPVTVAPEVEPTEEAAPIRDGEGNVVPVLIAPLSAEAPTQPATTPEQSAQPNVQEQEAPASTVVESDVVVAVGEAIPVPTAPEQTTLFDNGEITEAITPDSGVAEATTSDGAVVAIATAAVPGN